jgi:hypothetical protein
METESRQAHTTTEVIKRGRIGEMDENQIAQLVFFMGTFLWTLFKAC